MNTSPNQIPLPQLAHLSALTFRRFRGEVDYPTLVTIQHARAEADQIDPHSSYEGIPTLSSLAAEYATAEAFAPRDTTLVVEADGMGVAYTAVEWWEEQDGTWLFLHEAFVVPAWRNQGIEQALLDWSEQRLQDVANTLPTHGKAVWGANATSAEHERQALLLRVGYQEVFSMLEMELLSLEHQPSSPLTMPVTMRHAKREDYPALWEALQHAYTGRTMFEAFSEEDRRAFIDDPTHDPDCELVVWDGDTIAGMVFVHVDEHGQGVVDECNVRPAYRRRGIATTLMLQGLTLLQQQGASVVRLHVRKNNETGAQQVYERLGFHVRKEFLRFRKPMQSI